MLRAALIDPEITENDLMAVAQHPNADAKLLIMIARHPDASIGALLAVAQNQITDAEGFIAVVHNPNANAIVLAAVANHANADAALLSEINRIQQVQPDTAGNVFANLNDLNNPYANNATEVANADIAGELVAGPSNIGVFERVIPDSL